MRLGNVFCACLAGMLALIGALAVPDGLANAQNPFDGEKTYRTHCISCHGPNGTPGLAGVPSFAKGERMHLPDNMLLQSLQNGKGICPAWRPLLTNRQLVDALAYVRMLQR